MRTRKHKRARSGNAAQSKRNVCRGVHGESVQFAGRKDVTREIGGNSDSPEARVEACAAGERLRHCADLGPSDGPLLDGERAGIERYLEYPKQDGSCSSCRPAAD